MTPNASPPLIRYPSTITAERAALLVARYQAEQDNALKALRAPNSLFCADPEGGGDSFHFSGQYPDGTYRITAWTEESDELGRPTGYRPIEPDILSPEEPPDYVVIHRPHSMTEAAARHLVGIYRAGQKRTCNDHAPVFFKRRHDATGPSDRVSGAYPDGSYLVESGKGWRGDGPLSVLWGHPGADCDAFFVGTTPDDASFLSVAHYRQIIGWIFNGYYDFRATLSDLQDQLGISLRAEDLDAMIEEAKARCERR